MLEFIVLFACLVVAINNLTSILTTVDLLEQPRLWLGLRLGRFAKIVQCKYCQSFWLSGLSTLFVTNISYAVSLNFWIGWGITWFALHRAIEIFDQWATKAINDAPINIYGTVNVVKPLRDSEGTGLADSLGSSDSSDSDDVVYPYWD